MKIPSLIAGVVTVLALVGCTAPVAQSPATGRLPLARGVLSEISSSSLPPVLTDGAAAEAPYRSPNVRPAVTLLRRIQTSRRHSSVASAAKSLQFTPRLPLDPGGATLEYLLTRPEGPGGATPGSFWAVYSGGALQIAEWRQEAELGLPPGAVATQTVHGLPARINLHGSQNGQTNVLWKEGDMVFNLWYSGSLKEALRVAESVPLR